MRPIVLLFLAVWLGACSPPPKATPTPPRPVPVFSETTVDLGLVPSEREQSVTFEIRNEGDRELTIERVETTCGCAKPQFPKALAPGASGTVVVGYAPEPVAMGPQVETVKVFTNARQEPFELEFRADLQPLLRLAPGSPLVVPIEPGGTASQVIELTPRRGSGVRVEEVSSPDPRVVLERIPLPGDSYAVKATVRSKGSGDFIVPLRIQTSDSRLANLEYQLGAQAVRGPVSKPPKVVVPALAHDATKVVLPGVVVFARDRALVVRSAKATVKGVEVRVLEPDSLGTPLQIEYVGGWRAGSKRFEITVVTDDPQTPVLRIPVEVSVR